jgi:nitrogen fixation/metabolism regulation signal transduction histidine kinase
MNPIFLRAGLVLIAAVFAFAMGIVVFRRMRSSLTEVDSEIGHAPDSLNQLPLHTYHAVIQQLKQQKHELTAQQQMDRRRTRATENISAAVLSHLSSGVVFFNTAGLVRQANKAAKNILGYESPSGMSAGELFLATRPSIEPRGKHPGHSATPCLRHSRAGDALRGVRVEYRTPSIRNECSK